MNWTELFYTSWWLLRSTSSDFSIRQEDEFADYEGREAWEKGGFLGQKSALNFLLSLADLCVIVLRDAEVVPWVAQAENTEKLSVFAVNQVLFWNDLASFVFCDFWRRDSVTMSFPGKDAQTLLADKEDTHTYIYIIYIINSQTCTFHFSGDIWLAFDMIDVVKSCHTSGGTWYDQSAFQVLMEVNDLIGNTGRKVTRFWEKGKNRHFPREGASCDILELSVFSPNSLPVGF